MAEMTIYSYGRYGDHARATGEPAVRKLIRDRIHALCTEEFPRPDYEHCQTSVTHLPTDWSVTAYLEGVVCLYKTEGDGEPDRHMFGLAVSELTELFLEVARGDEPALLARPWVTEKQPEWWNADFYLLAAHAGMTDLHRAAAKGDVGWVDRLLTAGADPNAWDDYSATPLHTAALAGWFDVCERLLAAGADPTIEDGDGETPADYADGSDDYLSGEEVKRLVTLLYHGLQK